MIPEKAQGKVNEATVVAIGPGAKNKVCLAMTLGVSGACGEESNILIHSWNGDVDGQKHLLPAERASSIIKQRIQTL